MPWWHTAAASKARISILKHSIHSMARAATSAPSSAAFCCRHTSAAAEGQESGACDAGQGGVWSASTPTAFARPLSRSISASLQRISPISIWQSGLLHLPGPAVSCWSACVPCVVAWYCRQRTDKATNREHVRTSHTHTHTHTHTHRRVCERMCGNPGTCSVRWGTGKCAQPLVCGRTDSRSSSDVS